MSYKYAQVQHGKVLSVVDLDFPIVANRDDYCEWHDVTHATHTPQVGWRYNHTQGIFTPATEETILYESAKSEAAQAIDAAAGQARKKFITDIPGQSEIYREKYEQAIDFLSSTCQVRYSDFPLLEIESKILDVPLKNIAENVIKRRSVWMTKITAIESLRLYGKHNLDNCSNIQDVKKLKAHIIHKLTDLA